MRAEQLGARLDVVNVQRRVHVELDLEHTQDTIGGQLAIDGAPASGFHGWLELIDRLQRASAHAARGDARDPGDRSEEALG